MSLCESEAESHSVASAARALKPKGEVQLYEGISYLYSMGFFKGRNWKMMSAKMGAVEALCTFRNLGLEL